MRASLLPVVLAGTAIACGTDVKLPPPKDTIPFTADPPRVYVAKVKNILVGLPPTDGEIQAVVADPKALGGLVDQWMGTPEYQQKMMAYLELAFQQTQIGPGNYIQDFNYYLNQGLSNGTATNVNLLFENLRESFARTVLAFAANGQPFTDAFTSHQLMMTPAMMEFFGLADWFSYTGTMGAIDTFASTYPTASIYVHGSGTPIPLSSSVNPSDPNFLHFYNPGVATNHASNPTGCADPLVITKGLAQNLHEIIYGHVGLEFTTCGVAPTATNSYLQPSDFTTWKLVTIRQPNPGEARTMFFDMNYMRSGTELVLNTPHVGFFSTPPFFVNWPTNMSNQARVTINQTLIVALGTAIDGKDSTNPGPNPPGLDAAHASAGAACLGCHQLMDPTRSILLANYNYYYRPEDNATLKAQLGLFAFQGVVKPVQTIDDFAHVLATHPLVAPAWVQKLCYYVNSEACDTTDPEFQRLAADFQNTGFSWNALVKDVVTSPITTNAAYSKTWQTNGEVVSVARTDHMCAAINNRLGFVDICELDPTTHTPGSQTRFASLLSGMPSDGYGRGSPAPILPNLPSMFFAAGAEQMCMALAQAEIDAKPDPTQPGAKMWSSTQPTQAIADFVSIVAALTPSDSRSGPLTQVLTDHFTQAKAQGATATDALRSTFMIACQTPSFIGVGM